MTRQTATSLSDQLELILLECAISVGSGLRGMLCEPSATKYWKAEFSKTILKALRKGHQWKGKLRQQGLSAARLLGRAAAKAARKDHSETVKRKQAVQAKQEVVKKCFSKRSANGYAAAGVWCEV